MARSRTRKQTRQARGAAMVELALTLPVLMLLLMGCYEFARANMIRHATAAAAYEGARAGIVPGATPDDIHQAVDFVLGTVGVQNYTLVVQPNPLPVDAQSIKVTISLAMRDNTLMPGFFTKEAQLSGACKLGREGF